MKELDCHEVLTCRSDLLAGALENVHEALLEEKIPTGGDWMAERMISLIFEEMTTPVESLFKVGPRAVEYGEIARRLTCPAWAIRAQSRHAADLERTSFGVFNSHA